MITLNVSKRNIKAPLKELRKSGFIPAVYYGPKQESNPVAIKEVDLIKVWKQAGESSVVIIKDEAGEHDSLIHDIQKDPVSDRIIHADFYILEKGKKVSVKVPLEFVGVSEAVKSFGGTLMKVLHEIEIEAKPADLPHHIEVDISVLATFDIKIHASDLKLPNGVELHPDVKPEEVIALATPPREEKEEEAAPIDLTAIEVEKKGKKDEEGAEAAPAEEK
jgi:large subunit ribosomal protein L25